MSRISFALILGYSLLLAQADRAVDVTFSIPSGLQASPVSLEITATVAGTEIYYTTNGTVPAPTSGSRYGGPIRITGTTVIRAAGFRPGVEASLADSRTFAFPADILHQTGAGFPARWGVRNGRPVRAYYEMDSRMARDPASQGAMVEALKGLPAVSIVLDPSDLFDAMRGIYANPMEVGSGWERPAAVEFFNWPGHWRGAANCGLRIQGGWNRRPEESPKHAFRLSFRTRYGQSRLEEDLFGDGESSFETLILRAGCNNSWLHWSGAERRRGDYIRDQWMRETYAAMNHPSARGIFTHLYLNGLYWGIYNLVERPDAAFAASRLGGRPKDFDSRNADKILEGDGRAWERLFEVVNGGLKSQEAFKAVQDAVDLVAFADFMLVNLYGANADWDRGSNWYAARRRDPSGKFVFFVWDGERTLEQVEDNGLSADDDQCPTRLFQKLRESKEFRRLFAARARIHLTGDGALTPAAAAARYRKWVEVLDAPILAESARWGAYRRDVDPYKEGPYERYTRDDHWRPETRRLLEQYFPARTAVFIRQLREAGLFTD